jgi:hypothetical protein
MSLPFPKAHPIARGVWSGGDPYKQVASDSIYAYSDTAIFGGFEMQALGARPSGIPSF